MSSELHDHPAVRAWRRAQPNASIPVRVERLTRGGSNAVFRFYHGADASRPTIAKQRWRAGAQTEHIVYEKVLPQLPIPPVRCLGYADDDDPARAWVFVEDVGGGPYQRADREHRVVAARWLAGAHAFCMTGFGRAVLPERGPEHYLQLLRAAATMIESHLRADQFQGDDRQILFAVACGLAELENRWHRLESWCGAMPRTLVHGDFVAKNCRIGGSAGSDVRLLVFDWETAGWGPPAVDLATNALGDQGLSLHYTTYAREIRAIWDGFDAKELGHAIRVGDALRVLAAIKWGAVSLSHGWAPRDEMRFYVAPLARALRLVGTGAARRPRGAAAVSERVPKSVP
jgi:hypothetical protein